MSTITLLDFSTVWIHMFCFCAPRRVFGFPPLPDAFLCILMKHVGTVGAFNYRIFPLRYCMAPEPSLVGDRGCDSEFRFSGIAMLSNIRNYGIHSLVREIWASVDVQWECGSVSTSPRGPGMEQFLQSVKRVQKGPHGELIVSVEIVITHNESGPFSYVKGPVKYENARGLCLLGQRAMTLCRGALGLSDPTWDIHLPPVSEDKGQYSMPRGGQGQAGAYQSYDLPGELAGIARRGATPGGLVAIGVSVSGEEGGFLLGVYSQPASTALALRSHTHSGQPKRVAPFKAPAALFRPHVVPISEVISLWDPSAIRRSDSGKVESTVGSGPPATISKLVTHHNCLQFKCPLDPIREFMSGANPDSEHKTGAESTVSSARTSGVPAKSFLIARKDKLGNPIRSYGPQPVYTAGLYFSAFSSFVMLTYKLEPESLIWRTPPTTWNI
ncbi:hypothetical protein EDB89DRAFT_1907466 [Lactarius sanguifluus]|nr:hypothetical protein EDB89DRAFT_1907466 [Lactarius sanguifluus]